MNPEEENILFENFDQLFNYFDSLSVIEYSKDTEIGNLHLAKDYYRNLKKTGLNFGFNNWLKNKYGYSIEEWNEKYITLLTSENFFEFLNNENEEKKESQRQYEEKKKHAKIRVGLIEETRNNSFNIDTQLVKALQPQQISVDESRTKKVIFETITNIDKQGWQYAFVSEQDYNLFTDLLTNFFEYKPYTLPETTIQLKRTCKTKVAKALGEIHKELSNENKLSTDKEYFKIIRVLNHFKNETEVDLYKALTR